MADAAAALAWLNSAPDNELDAVLGGICSSPAWAAALRATRPWPDTDALLGANSAAVAGLGAEDLNEALAGHARIGRPAEGDAAAQREQAGVRGADPALLDELHRANAAYEAKFGHLFLICATDRTAAALLAALRERHGNDAATEAQIVRAEMCRINAIRINRLLDGNP